MKKILIRRRNDYKTANGEAPLYASFYIEKTRMRIPLGLTATEKEWDDESGYFRGRDKLSKDKNLIIDTERAKITDVLVKFRLSGETLTPKKFLAALKEPGSATNFNTFAARHLEAVKTALRSGTLRHHTAVLKKLANYAPALTISEITADWLRVYAAHLRNVHNNNDGTIRKNLGVIRVYYYAAMREGKTTLNPFKDFRMPAATPEVVYLTEKELNKLVALYKANNIPDVEQEVLRFFLFMAFTGMHISDARAIQLEQIREGEIHYRRMKTGVAVSVPLSRPALALVNYYKAGRRRGNLVHGLPTDPAFNRILKKIGARIGLTKSISAKTARHTFATLYYQKNAGDLGTLSKLLGHSSIQTTMVYAHISREERFNGVAVFNGFI